VVAPRAAQTASYREAPPRPPPARPPIKLRAVAAVGCLALTLFTSNKLWTMARLRGDIDGIPEREMIVGRELRRFQSRSNAVVFRLRDEQGSDWEIQLNEGNPRRNRTGERIRVRCLESSRDCYARESVYIDDGNRQFDIALLTIEIAGLIASLLLIRHRIKTWRQTERLTAPPRG
jgi:hypothetical protein